MKKSFKWRLAGFLAGILAMLTLVTWSALTTWESVNNVERRFVLVEQLSFHFADRLQQTLMRLNHLMLRYQARPEENTWEEFEQTRAFLENWLNGIKQTLPPDEQRTHAELVVMYKDLHNAAQAIHRVLAASQPLANAAEATRSFEMQSKRMFNKATELANAQRQAQQRLLSEFNAELSKMQGLLFFALVMIVASSTGVALMVYRELLAPLRHELIESRALIERQEKLASLGVLAAGVAHEIRNPLTAIKARLFTLRKGLKDGSREQTDAVVIDQEINRLERIVKDFLMFARPSEPEWSVVPAGDPLVEIEQLLRATLEKSGLQLVVEPAPKAWVRIDPQQIKQVLMNLVQNAAEALSHQGRIVLRVRLGHAVLREKTTAVVILEVQDNGKGIPPEAQAHLFDPFFSTKEAGTGLGLSIAARLVEKHGGLLNYQTALNLGTTFSIILPKVEPA